MWQVQRPVNAACTFSSTGVERMSLCFAHMSRWLLGWLVCVRKAKPRSLTKAAAGLKFNYGKLRLEAWLEYGRCWPR